VARTLLSANPGSTHPQRSPQPRHPERSRAIREANGPAKSKDPYSLPISRERGPQLSLPGVRPFSRFSRRGHHEPQHQGICSSVRSPELSSECSKCGADTPVPEPRQHPPQPSPQPRHREGAITNLSIKGFVQAADRRNCHPNGSSVARTLLSANPGSTHPQPSPKPRHPERSRAIREANGPAKSKDPYSLPISKPSELRRGSRPSGRNFDPLAPARSCTFQWKEKQQSNKWSKSSIPGPAHCRVALIQAKKRLEGAKISKKKPEKLIPP